MRLLCCLMFLLIPNIANASTSVLPKHSPNPGGVAIVHITSKGGDKPQATFMTKKVMIKKQDDNSQNWLAIVGLPLDIKPGRYSLEVNKKNGVDQIFFEVKPKDYPTEHLRITNNNLVNPDEESLTRIGKESVLLKRAYATFSSHNSKSLKISLPLQGRFSSPYGLRRYMNGSPKKPHSGLDIAAPVGTPVKAVKSGKVILTGNFFYSGNTIYVDHGEGFISSYCHLDKIETTQDKWVEENDIIGTVGATGRVTGPHLHLSICLNGNLVDPNLFL